MKRVAFMTDQHFDTSSRWEETLRIARWCEDKIAELEVDAIALGGDMFERRPNPVEVRAVCEHVQRLANIAPVVAVYGNHDVAESLAPLNLLEAEHPISVVDRPETVIAGGILFALLPWPKRAQLLAATAGLDREQAGAVGLEALQNVLRGLAQADHDRQLPHCFVGHVQLSGAKVSTGQPLAPGADFELSLADLALAKADAYLLGHIHLGDNEWRVGDEPVLYGGSLRRTTYGELEEKYLTVVTFDDQHRATVERIVIPTTPMLLLEATFDNGLCLNEWPVANVRGAEIRLRYRCKREEREAARAKAQELRDALLDDGALTVKLEEIVSVEGRSRATIADTLNPEQRLESFWATKGFEPGVRRPVLLEKFRGVLCD